MREKSSFLARLDANMKWLAVLVLGLATVIDTGILLGYGLTGLLFILAVQSNIGSGFLKVMLSLMLPMALMVIGIQGFFYNQNQRMLWQLGSLAFGLEGVMKALNVLGTVSVFFASFYLLIKTTENSQMVASFRRIGLPAKFAYLLLATLSVVPQMQGTAKKIREAQSSRGLQTDGAVWSRLKAFIPLITPLIIRSLLDSQERGMTLEMRGISLKGKKTSFIESSPSRLDHLLVGGLIVFLLTVIGYRLLIGWAL